MRRCVIGVVVMLVVLASGLPAQEPRRHHLLGTWRMEYSVEGTTATQYITVNRIEADGHVRASTNTGIRYGGWLLGETRVILLQEGAAPSLDLFTWDWQRPRRGGAHHARTQIDAPNPYQIWAGWTRLIVTRMDWGDD